MSDPIPTTGPCNWCGRPAPLRNVLQGTASGIPYRFGYYLCRWHKAAETRRQRP